MRASHIILAGIAGTTAFTLFSYIVSKKQKKNFREPQLLGDMVDTTVHEVSASTARSTGWLLHYLTGTGFSTCYAILFRYANVKPTLTNGLLAGAASGVVAIAWWDTALSMHPAPPRKPNKQYFGHLFLGHVIFGAAAFLTFNLLNNKKQANDDAQVPDPLSFSYKLSRYATSGS